MGLGEVKKEIIKKAKNDAEEIIKSAELSAKDLVNSAKAEIDKYKIAEEIKNKKFIENKEKIVIADSNTEVKNILLKKKKEMIDVAFGSAKKLLIKNSKSKGYINRLLRKAESEIEIGVIYCNKEDTHLIKGYKVYEMNIHGIIAENKEGTVRIDYMFDTILEDIKNKFLNEIAEILLKE